VVRAFYNLWDQHRLPEAYELLSNRYRSEHPYDTWAASHESVVHISVTTTPTDNPMTVAVFVQSLDQTSNGTVRTQYRGSWTAVIEHGMTRLDSVELAEVP
jgi:hypothetical protein